MKEWHTLKSGREMDSMPGRLRSVIIASASWVMVAVWAWPRVQAGKGDCGIWDWQICDHLPCSTFLYFDACFWFFDGNPQGKSIVKTLIYSAKVAPFLSWVSFLFYLVIPSFSQMLPLCIYVLHLYSFLIHQSLLPISICFLSIRN